MAKYKVVQDVSSYVEVEVEAGDKQSARSKGIDLLQDMDSDTWNDQIIRNQVTSMTSVEEI